MDAAIADYIKKVFNLGSHHMAEVIKIQHRLGHPARPELSMTVRVATHPGSRVRPRSRPTRSQSSRRSLRDMIKAIKDVLQETPPNSGRHHRPRHHYEALFIAAQLPELVFRRTGVKGPPRRRALLLRRGTGCPRTFDTYKRHYPRIADNHFTTHSRVLTKNPYLIAFFGPDRA